MADHAQVHSVEAIEAFRTSLLVYLDKVRPLVDEVSADLRRTLLWMESDRRLHWEREVRRRAQVLEEAQQALLSARFATFREVTVVEQSAVHAARRALAEGEEKLRTLRKWILEFGPRTSTLARQLNALDAVLHQDLPKAVALLGEIVGHLEAYAEVRRDFTDPPVAGAIAEASAGAEPGTTDPSASVPAPPLASSAPETPPPKAVPA